MPRLIMLIHAILFLYPQSSFGCSCLTPRSFCESILGENDEVRADVIVRGKLNRRSNGEDNIKISQVLYGRLIQDEILLQYSFCDLFTNQLEDGKEYVFALRSSGQGYGLLACAISFLKIQNGKVVGPIAPGIDKLSYLEFLSLGGCGNLQLHSLANLISVFPNPVGANLNIKNISPEKELENLSVIVSDIMGRNVSNRIDVQGILPEEFVTVNVSNLLPGVYIVRISDGIGEQASRIVKQ